MANLTADQMAAISNATNPTYINGDSGTPVYGNPLAAFNIGGYNYAPAGNGSYWRFAYDPSVSSPSGYAGRAYDKVDAQGSITSGGNLPSDYGKFNFMEAYAPFAMMAAGMAPALMGAGAMGAGGASSIDTLGMQGLPSYSSLAAGDQAALAGIGGGAADAAGAAGAAGSGAAGAAGDIETMGSVAPYSMSPVSIPGTMAPISAGGGFLADIAAKLGVSPGLLTAGATALGALAGSRPVKQTQNGTMSKDPRVAPYLFGDGTNASPGLLNYAQQQLARDMSPENQAMLDSLKSKGMGLLNQPVAQNGFATFTKGRY